uniref:Uncharacterized protein n=1 Tax=Arundo donax TaxID=35708 RepID=A0A0A9BM52_ARUDO
MHLNMMPPHNVNLSIRWHTSKTRAVLCQGL